MIEWNLSAKDKNHLVSHSETIIGYIYTFLAYLLWGFLALYWHALDAVSSMEILAHRILWGFIFVVMIMIFQPKKRIAFFKLLKEFKTNFKQFFYIFVASLAISANWLTFIWAVHFGYIMEASLGLYITPIVSMILGVLIVKERIQTGTMISMVIAILGVLIITYDYGKIPWVAISLAITSGIYGLTKKFIQTDALVGMCIETLMVFPFALLFLVFIQQNVFFGSDMHITLLLIFGGILTVLPLLWFAEGLKRISLATIGFFQYITPTITFLLGIFIFENTVTLMHWISFSFIWLSLAVFSFSMRKGRTTS
ncbi:EamA family transporter RarD [Cytobacillus depressus]|uniref:EamA family transporter RarD n=1 Tax=Cytobacillus depressus TaxID=1602942 RepID=A0A6L3UZ91_9BACI|nr:EamA family transporter RarD [Cytobacillus depressus]KAB2328310.1 EamA family transporter RarD [Cytobacillus depressus]